MALLQSLAAQPSWVPAPPQGMFQPRPSSPSTSTYPMPQSHNQTHPNLNCPQPVCGNVPKSYLSSTTGLLSPKYGQLAASPFPITYPPLEFYANPLTPAPGRKDQSRIPPPRSGAMLRKSMSSPALPQLAEPHSHPSTSQHPSIPPSINTAQPPPSQLRPASDEEWPLLTHTLSSIGTPITRCQAASTSLANQQAPPPSTTSIPSSIQTPQAVSSLPACGQLLSSGQSAWSMPLVAERIKLPTSMPTPSWSDGDPCLSFSEDMEAAAMESFKFAVMGRFDGKRPSLQWLESNIKKA